MPEKKTLKLQIVATAVASTSAATVAATAAQTHGGGVPSFIVLSLGRVRRRV